MTRRNRPARLSRAAARELDGTGDWTLWDEDGRTAVRYVWAIHTTRAWMNLLAPLPFVDPIVRLNHHAVMRNGLAGIRGRRGGVDGSYTRED